MVLGVPVILAWRPTAFGTSSARVPHSHGARRPCRGQHGGHGGNRARGDGACNSSVSTVLQVRVALGLGVVGDLRMALSRSAASSI